MCEFIPERRHLAAPKLFKQFTLLVCVCVGLIIMAPAHAMIFRTIDPFTTASPRTIPGIDSEVLNTIEEVERIIAVTSGGAALTGTTLEIPGGSVVTTHYSFTNPVDLINSGENALSMLFDLSGGTDVHISLFARPDSNTEFIEIGSQLITGDGPHRADFLLNPALTTTQLQEIKELIAEYHTNGAANTFSLDEFGTASVVPVPAAVWLFGSGLLGLIGISRRKKTY